VIADSVLGQGSTSTVTLQAQSAEAVNDTPRARPPAGWPATDQSEHSDSTRSEEPHVRNLTPRRGRSRSCSPTTTTRRTASSPAMRCRTPRWPTR